MSYFNTVCPICNQVYTPSTMGHVCIPKPITPSGWLCPACGRGNSPYSNICPCNPIPITITYKGTHD